MQKITTLLRRLEFEVTSATIEYGLIGAGMSLALVAAIIRFAFAK